MVSVLLHYLEEGDFRYARNDEMAFPSPLTERGTGREKASGYSRRGTDIMNLFYQVFDKGLSMASPALSAR